MYEELLTQNDCFNDKKHQVGSVAKYGEKRERGKEMVGQG